MCQRTNSLTTEIFLVTLLGGLNFPFQTKPLKEGNNMKDDEEGAYKNSDDTKFILSGKNKKKEKNQSFL